MIVFYLTSSRHGAGEVVSVLLITAAVFVLAWLAARFLARRSLPARQGRAMQLVDRLALGKDRQLLLVKVGEEYYLVGLTAQSIQFSQPVRPGDFASVLAEKQGSGENFWSAPDPAEAKPQSFQPSSVQPRSFAEKLSRMINWRQHWQNQAAGSAAPAEPIRRGQHER